MTDVFDDPEFLRLLDAEMQAHGLDQASVTGAGAAPGGSAPDAASRLTRAETRLWFLHRLDPDSAAYNIAAGVRLSGPLDVRRLFDAFSAVVSRYEALRTVFEDERGRPRARALSPQDLSPETVLGEDFVSSEEAHQWLAGQARRPFDLAGGPLARLAVARAAENEYLVCLCVHHIVGDGDSLDLITAEMFGQYAGAPAGPVVPRRVTGPAPETEQRELDWWRARVADAPTVVELPSDHPRPAVQGNNGRRIERLLDAELTSGIAGFARELRVTSSSVHLALYRYLLQVLTGERDLLIGCPVTTRRAEDAPHVGNFVNMVCLRTPAADDPLVRELVAREHRSTSEAVSHRDLPFERLVEALDIERERSRPPLVQAVFNHRRTETGAGGLPGGLFAERLEVDLGISKFDLTLTVEDAADGTRLYLEYDSDLIRATTARSWLACYEALLTGAVAAPDAPLSTLGFGAPAPLPVGTRHTPPRLGPRGIVGWFEEQAAAHPEREAVVHGSTRTGYGELNRRAEALAHRIGRRAADPRVPVAVLTRRGTDLVVAMLAVAKAGLTALPLDEEHPKLRLRSLLQDAGCTVLVGDPSLAEWVGAGRLDVIPPNGPEDDPAAQGFEPHPVTSGTPLYRIYTSGSTGAPKGVTVTHGNLASLLAEGRAALGYGAADRWTLFHSIAFDFSVWEIWGPLTSGGTVVVVDRDTARAPDRFLRLLIDERVSVLNQTPTAFDSLVHLWAGTHAPFPAALRTVVFGGEALRPAALRPWFRLPVADLPRLVNMYGITETTVHVTLREITREDADRPMTGSPIGVPLPHLAAYVLDPWARPLPPGIPGELHVGGKGVAQGYAGRDALTGTRFVPDPFAADGSPMYRTGDRVRLLADGELEYLGRVDAQVKVRGFRIEPGEVEAAVAAHPAVAATGVVADEGRLIAFVVPAHDGLDAAELRAHLAARLPAHMVPVLAMATDLPRTVNGKLDRRALRENARKAQLADAVRSVYRAPRGASEEAIAAIWAEVLQSERVGAEDNFFELGGDSIRAVQVAALAQEKGLGVSVADVFAAQTVAELAVLAGESAVQKHTGTRPFELTDPADRPLLPESCEDAYPLTLLQQGMVFHQLDDAAYLNVTGVAVRAALDEGLLRAAVRHVMARHAVLRTSFDLSACSEPLQLVHRTVEPPVTVVDLRDRNGAPLAHDDAAARVDAWMREERGRALDLGHAPLFRITVHRADTDLFWFCVTECHAILDGWSFTSTVSEILGTYGILLTGGELPAAEAPATLFRDFVADECKALDDPAAREFWNEALAGAEPLELPVRRGERSAAAERRVVPLPLDVQRGLERLAGRLGAPVKDVLLAAHVAVLALWTGRDDVLTGLVVNGRPETAGAEDTRGMYLNTLPVRLRTAGLTGTTLAKECFRAETALLRHRTYPGAALERRSAHGPLITAVFNYTRFHALGELHKDEPGPSAVRLSGEFQEIAPTNYPLYVSFDHGTDEAHGHLALLMAASPRHFAPWETDQLVELYRSALKWLATEPEEPLSSRHVLGPDARRTVLNEWGRGRPGAPSPLPVPDRIRARAAERPTAPAVTDARGTYSYAELAEAAARMADGLRAAGVRPGAPVAVCLPRCMELIAAAVAVWQCGGAYVPLDPAQPAARTGLIGEVARPRAVVVDARTLHRVPHGAAVVRADTPSEAQPGAAHAAVLPEAVAYEMFTSGSTGRPKGVAVSHQALAVFADAVTGEWSSADSVLAVTTAGFDISIVELLLPLTAGARLVLHDTGGVLDPDALMTALRTAGASLLQATPTVWGALADAQGDLAGLRGWCGGEALPAPVAETLLGRGVRLENWYGPTETTIWSTALEVTDAHLDRGVVPIGRPLPGERMYVLDEALHPVPAGVVGDLHIGGGGLAQGYVDQPGATAARFVPDPFAGDGTRMYRTGDRARWRTDGVLEFRGRDDDQVKVRGVRVEVADVESVVRSHPAVQQVGVVLRDDRLIACTTARPDAEDTFDAAEVRRHAARTLPAPVVPTVVRVARLPFNANGKVDRKALRTVEVADDPGRGTDCAEHVEPRTPMEARLARIWQDVLGVKKVGRTADFFDLGGDSLRALRLVAKAAGQGITLSPADLFRHPVLADLAAVAAAAGPAPATAFDDGPGPVPILPRARVFFERTGDDPALEQMCQYLELDTDLAPEAVRTALEWVARRHSALRMRWQRTAEGWRQYVAERPDLVTFQVLDLRELSEDERGERLGEFEHTVRAVTALEHEPPWSVTLVRLRPGRSRLLFAVHHLVVDGYSWQQLMEDFHHAYEQAALGGELDDAPVTGFAAWARASVAAARRPEVQELAGHWARVLDGFRPVPVDHDPGPPTRGEQLKLPLSLAPAATARLRELRDDEGRPLLEAVLATALARAYHRWADGRPLLLGVLTQGRDGYGAVAGPEPDPSGAVGWYTGMFPVRIDAVPEETSHDALRRVGGLLPGRPLLRNSFGLLRYLADGTPGARALRQLRQPQIHLNYYGERSPNPLLTQGPFIRPLDPPPAPMQDAEAQPEALIEFVLEIVDGALEGSVWYSHRHFTRHRVAQFSACIQQELTALAQL
ncbi:amino acid adenylation domain-containing protein (plasmid) [Streptomyces sp. NBC_00825]|uniref:amino acid adenylation domain-containing protein n=1 Tax=unclassified Streptomyces TaxID=2593676 RepID=UPI002ED1501D|nr:amino acid adenylation domain-containing protein [Streptomyces sp. NBC_00826]WTH96208.1 amino acid adenylation domain-containing protein [Streptomyces sp. NBC_00825]WTI04769.1 amino acid adenylation domain-containing protein [Streptomyces sp. NBC_00822]